LVSLNCLSQIFIRYNMFWNYSDWTKEAEDHSDTENGMFLTTHFMKTISKGKN